MPAGTDVKFRIWNDYTIEADWDYGFVEVSTDGGTTWAEQKVYNAAGTRGHHARWLRRPERPDGRLRRQEVRPDRRQRRLAARTTSTSRRSPAQNIKLRLRYATDEAFLERGWFADDFSVTNGATTCWSDNTDTNNGWTNTVASFTGTDGCGLEARPGKSQAAHYYLAEWRNLDGFDKGLHYAYDSTYTPTTPGTGGAWRVEKVKYNAPGMLVWYRDTSYGNDNHVTRTCSTCRAPARRAGCCSWTRTSTRCATPGTAAASTLRRRRCSRGRMENFPARMNASDVAFTTWGTNPAEDCFSTRRRTTCTARRTATVAR